MDTRSRRFWILIALTSVLESFAGATLAAAAFTMDLPAGVHVYGYTAAVFGRTVDVTWSSDGGLLVMAGCLAAIGVVAFFAADRSR